MWYLEAPSPPSFPSPMKRPIPFRLLGALLAPFFLLPFSSARAANEIGAYENGVWNPTAVPEFSVVLFRWGTRDSDLTGKDRILGQVASLKHTSFTMVLRTPDTAPVHYEMTIGGGVQIFGEGMVATCTECPFSRKYNGTTLVSRGAYTTDICCFVVDFDQLKGVSSMKIVDMKANGRSVPYMVKFSTQPLMTRDGLKVPIPGKCRLHEGTVSSRPLDGPSGSDDGKNVSAVSWSGADGADEATADRAMKELAADNGTPRLRIQDGACLSGPFYAMVGQSGKAFDLSFSAPGGDASSVVVEGPGFRLRGMNEVRAFAVALKTCGVSGARLASNPAAFGKPIPGASFPAIETKEADGFKKSAVRAILLPGRSGPFFRLESVPSGHEIFTSKVSYVPGLLKLVNPQDPLKKLSGRP